MELFNICGRSSYLRATLPLCSPCAPHPIQPRHYARIWKLFKHISLSRGGDGKRHFRYTYCFFFFFSFFLQELPSQSFTLNAKAQGFSSRFLSSHAHRGRLIREEDLYTYKALEVNSLKAILCKLRSAHVKNISKIPLARTFPLNALIPCQLETVVRYSKSWTGMGVNPVSATQPTSSALLTTDLLFVRRCWKWYHLSNCGV